MVLCVFFIVNTGYPETVKVFKTSNGFLRLKHNGYSFGCRVRDLNANKEALHWRCTSTRGNKKGCNGTILTSRASGHTKMKIRQPHTCIIRLD